MIIYLVEYPSRVWRIDALEILTCNMPKMSEQIVRQNHAIGTSRKMLVQELAHKQSDTLHLSATGHILEIWTLSLHQFYGHIF